MITEIEKMKIEIEIYNKIVDSNNKESEKLFAQLKTSMVVNADGVKDYTIESHKLESKIDMLSDLNTSYKNYIQVLKVALKTQINSMY